MTAQRTEPSDAEPERVVRNGRLYRVAGNRVGTWWTSILRVVFGLVWLVDAWYKWQPAFMRDNVGMIGRAAAGQPSWLVPWFQFWHWLMGQQPTLFSYTVALGETLLALALIVGLARKFTYLLGAAWSLMIWTTAEGFGKADGGMQTDLGTAIVYFIVFLALLGLDLRSGTREISLDKLIERRYPWWRRLAEVQR